MTIRPVLVPDHDAAELRKLMDSFAEAATAPVKKKLTESADQGVAEATMSRAAKGYEKYGRAGMAALAKAGREGRALDPVRDKYNRYDEGAEADVTEDKPDVMRHAGDKTIQVVKRGGKPIGEIGTDSEASPGNGAYYIKLYDGSYDAVGFDSAEEALEELKAAIKQGIAEQTASVFKPGDRVQFTSPRGAVEDGVVVKDLYSGAVEVKFNNGETRGVYANSLKPLPAAVEESIDPVEQLRADIKRFAR